MPEVRRAGCGAQTGVRVSPYGCATVRSPGLQVFRLVPELEHETRPRTARCAGNQQEQIMSREINWYYFRKG